ncbi:MAG: hypothetical protein ACOYXT_27035 [Bacteroidota bacterium]
MTRLLNIGLIFLIACSSPKREQKKIVVGLQPLNKVPQEYLDTVALIINRAYGFRVTQLPTFKLGNRFIVNIKAPRYRADSIIHYFKYHKPDYIGVMLAITEKDISVTKRDILGNIKKPKSKYLDWGVFWLWLSTGAKLCRFYFSN